MPSRNSNARVLAALLLSGISLAVSGCNEKKVQAARPVDSAPAATAIQTPPPSTTAPDTTAMPPVASAQVPPPEVPASSTAPPPIVAPTTKPAPKPQRPAPEQPAPVAEDHARPPAPQISPQLSDDAKANYQRGTAEDIGVAEGNLQQAKGKRLNAQQLDLVDKIRNFLDQSSNATKEGDLARAKNLAQKARLLSVELINSL
jgi:outer membrane biosynthesis protein TonB